MAGAAPGQAGAEGRASPAGGPQARPAAQDYAGALDQVAQDLSLLAGRLDVPEPDEPSLEEPWDQVAADALVDLYESGGAGLSHRLSDDVDLQSRLARIAPGHAAGEPDAAQQDRGIARDWIESRFAEVTRAVEQSRGRADAGGAMQALGQRFERLEQRFDAAIASVAPRADAEALRQLEAKVGQLFAKADEARDELGRLLAIEAQLGELRAGMSDDRLATLARAAAPTHDELTDLAHTAADRVCERFASRDRHEAIAGPSEIVDTLSPEISGMRQLLADFIDERRRSEQQVAEALDTMQDAMQHVLDRIEAIEAGQAAMDERAVTLPEEPSDDEYPGDLAYVPGESTFEDGPETALAADYLQPVRSDDAVGREEHLPLEAGPLEAGPRDAAVPASDSGDDAWRASPRSSQATDRAAFIARARMAAEKAASDARAIPTFERAAQADPKWIPQTGRPLVRPGVLLAVSLAAFLLAGYWLVYGSKSRFMDEGSQTPTEAAKPVGGGASAGDPLREFRPGHAGGTGPGAPEDVFERRTPGGRTGQGHPIPETQASTGDGDALPSEPGQLAAPGGDNLVQGPVGVIIDQGHSTLTPQDLMRLRQKQRMARLSTRLGQHAAQSLAQPIVLQADDGAVPQGESAAATFRPMPLPPITIGPHSLRHAAANGDASAQLEVAVRFAEGKGVKQDFARAATWYQRAASQGLAVAQYRLATLYERGLGVAKDDGRARVWYGRAAGQGNLKAMHNLAVLSAGGETPDYSAAARWFAEAASYGLTDSQYNLGVLYEAGHGVAIDPQRAFKWYALAAAGGDKQAVRRRDVAKGKLGSAALRAAEAEVAAWRARALDKLANDARAAGQTWKVRAAGGTN